MSYSNYEEVEDFDESFVNKSDKKKANSYDAHFSLYDYEETETEKETAESLVESTHLYNSSNSNELGRSAYEDAEDAISGSSGLYRLTDTTNYEEGGEEEKIPKEKAVVVENKTKESKKKKVEEVVEALPAVDWHSVYLKLFANYEKNPSVNTAEELMRLVDEFTREAITIGKLIIEEMGCYIKKIKPIDAGGIAGGVKYLYRNIFFKVSVDEHNLYGSDRVAGKVGSIEILSNNYLLFAYNKVQRELPISIRFPLCCCINFCGITLLASTKLPLTKDSLIYGSNDGGQTVHADIPEFNKAMDILGSQMNLKKHVCKGGVELSFPVDIEGHKGTDGVYYLLDTARVFPPERPVKPSVKGSYLYRLLRPNFVMNLQNEKLSSDAFSGFQREDIEAPKHNSEIITATEKLHSEIIPFCLERFKAKGQMLKMFEVDGSFLCGQLHLLGLNIRHLGRLHHLARQEKNERLIKILESEIISRSAKNVIRELLAEDPLKISNEGAGEAHRSLMMDVFEKRKHDERLLKMACVAFPLFEATKLELSQKVRARTMKLMGCEEKEGGFHCKPLVKSLHTFSFFLAFELVEESHKDVGTENNRKAVESYAYSLQNFTGADSTIYNNLGCALVELIRKLKSTSNDNKEISGLLSLAELSFSDAIDLLEMQQTKDYRLFAETLMNWANVARWKGELHVKHLRVMEARIERALNMQDCPTSCIHNGLFLLSKKAVLTNDQTLLQTSRDRLKKLIENEGDKLNTGIAVYDLALISMWLGDTNAAIENFQKATQFAESAAGALYMLACVAYDKGDYVQSIEQAKKCLEVDSTFFKANYILGKSLFRSLPHDPQPRFEQLKEAVREFETTLASTDGNGEVEFLLGSCYLEIYHLMDPNNPPVGIIKSAMHYLREGVEHGHSHDPIAWITRGNTAFKLSMVTQAHQGYSCDECGNSIIGIRYHCSVCNEGDYDACESCKVDHKHELETFENVAHQKLLEEASDCVVIGLQLFDITIQSNELIDFLSSENEGVVKQALDMMSKLATYDTWKQKFIGQNVFKVISDNFEALGKMEIYFLYLMKDYTPNFKQILGEMFEKRIKNAIANDELEPWVKELSVELQSIIESKPQQINNKVM